MADAPERNQILEMLASGKITPEQAGKLLDALGESDPLAPEREVLVGEGTSDRFARRVERVARRAERQVERVIHRSERRMRDGIGVKVLKPLDFDQLVQLSIHGVRPQFVKEVREAGLGDLGFDELIQLAIHGVTPDYFRQMRETLGSDITFDELIQLAIHGVSADYVEEIKAAGLEDIDVDQVVQLAIHGVSPEYFREMRDLAAAMTNEVAADDEGDEDGDELTDGTAAEAKPEEASEDK